jgi:hypothetical protein
MELEFDKEINAILRKAGRTAGTAAARSPHVDADTIAAFAENAMPQRARPPLIEHFAACDACRETLAQTIILSREADATAASTVVGAPTEIVVPFVPWYRKLFSTPGLALAMGALVIAFTGLIGYLAIQDRRGSSTEVSQITEPDTVRGGPYDSGETAAAATNASSNSTTANTSAFSASNAAPAANSNAASTVTGTLAARRPEDELRTASSNDSGTALDGVASQPTEPSALAGAKPVSPPPPPVTTDATKTEADEKKMAEMRDKDAEMARDREADDRGVRRDAPAAAAKSGPARSGPFQMKSNQSNQAYDMSVTRVVGGKTFNNRNGAWYDSAYRNQSTKDIRRGTDEFKKLDGGLRSIANNLGGVVVVVWNGKAYRIQ